MALQDLLNEEWEYLSLFKHKKMKEQNHNSWAIVENGILIQYSSAALAIYNNSKLFFFFHLLYKKSSYYLTFSEIFPLTPSPVVS